MQATHVRSPHCGGANAWNPTKNSYSWHAYRTKHKAHVQPISQQVTHFPLLLSMNQGTTTSLRIDLTHDSQVKANSHILIRRNSICLDQDPYYNTVNIRTRHKYTNACEMTCLLFGRLYFYVINGSFHPCVWMLFYVWELA